MTLNCQHFTLINTHCFIMTRTIALGMLEVANTGNDLLQVLDVIQQDSESAAANTGEGDMQ